MRTILDKNGRSWRIWHVMPQSKVLVQTSPALGGGWLCFESDGDKRRMVGPPPHWERMSEAELLELLERAARVAKVAQ